MYGKMSKEMAERGEKKVENAKKRVDPNIKKYIDHAISEGIRAGLDIARQREKSRFNAYRATEERLYAMPVLTEKTIKDKERLQELIDNPELPQRSKDIKRFQRSGQRLDEEEILEAIIQDLQAQIAADEHEIHAINLALETIKEDEYYPALAGRYFNAKNDKTIAVDLRCDETTVWRNRRRLVKRLAVRLYGVEALSDRPESKQGTS